MNNTENNKKKRWISLYVENQIGVLAKVAGLFSGKGYNMDSLTVGTAEDESTSRMTISLTSDDKTYEQILKQLNRCVEIIKVVDYTEMRSHIKEIMFVKVMSCKEKDMEELFRIAKVFAIDIVDYNKTTALLECVKTESVNTDIVNLLEKTFPNRLEVVRGGNVAIDSVSTSLR